MRKINIALPKGKRLLAPAYRVFKNAGLTSLNLEYEIVDIKRKRLEYESDCGTVTFILVRISDIPKYIDKNWADIGISASDCYREYELENIGLKNNLRGDNFITDLLPDLKLCPKLKFCVAGLPQKREFYEKCKKNDEKILEVATQHPNIAAKYFKNLNILVDIMSIRGSSEIMPKYGGVDVIFDIVETGQTLIENGLSIFEVAFSIQTKLIVSRAALRYDENVLKLIEKIKKSIIFTQT